MSSTKSQIYLDTDFILGFEECGGSQEYILHLANWVELTEHSFLFFFFTSIHLLSLWTVLFCVDFLFSKSVYITVHLLL